METATGFTVGYLVFAVLITGVGMGIIGFIIGNRLVRGYATGSMDIRLNDIYEVVVPPTATGDGKGTMFAILKEQDGPLRFFIFSGQVENGKFLKAVRSETGIGEIKLVSLKA